MSPEHLTVLRTLLDDKTPAPLTYNEAVLVEYVKMLATKAMDVVELYGVERGNLIDVLEMGGF